jgi:prepilin-type N-terminal cleavage/methylation domain-containing protein
LRGPYAKSELPEWLRSLGAWIGAYAVSAASGLLVIGACHQVGTLVHFNSEHTARTALHWFLIWSLPLHLFAWKMRRPWLAAALPALPSLVFAIRALWWYVTIELPTMQPVWWWIAKDVSYFPVWLGQLVLAAYIARRAVHAWLRHDSLRPTWGRAKAAPAATGTTAGFTLVELLVVIAIIALLAGILFPVVARARRRGHQATDISNMRQIATAIAMYRQDHASAPLELSDMIPAYVESSDTFVSPADPVLPYGWWTVFRGESRYLPGQTYVYMPGCGEDPRVAQSQAYSRFYDRTTEQPGWGILCCPVYMDVDERYWSSLPVIAESGDVVEVRIWDYWAAGGLQLRVAADGSLRRVRMPPRTSQVGYPYFLMDEDQIPGG